MKLPFTTEQFFNVFKQYNLAVAPFQFLLYLLAATAIYLAFRKTPVSGKVTMFILAFLWLWMGAVYHLAFFAGINRAANFFGIAFIIEGLFFLFAGVTQQLSFRFRPSVFGIAGIALIVYALIVYPLLGSIAGHVYPASPAFGLPCPTTIFTFGILLFSVNKLPVYLLIIPLLWSLIGSMAAVSLGVWEDGGLLIAGMAGTVLTLVHNRRSENTGNKNELIFE